MYIKMDDKLRSIHRHVKTVKGVELTTEGMNKVREAVSTATEDNLAPGCNVLGLVIATCVNRMTTGKIETTVTLKAPPALEDWESLRV